MLFKLSSQKQLEIPPTIFTEKLSSIKKKKTDNKKDHMVHTSVGTPILTIRAFFLLIPQLKINQAFDIILPLQTLYFRPCRHYSTSFWITHHQYFQALCCASQKRLLQHLQPNT